MSSILTSFKGKITCANVLSDLYAMGVTDCDNMLMLVNNSYTVSSDPNLISDLLKPHLSEAKLSYIGLALKPVRRIKA